MTRVGLVGYGKAGQAVAQVLRSDPRFELTWIARRTHMAEPEFLSGSDIPVMAIDAGNFAQLMDAHPVDALVDFSSAESIQIYAGEVERRNLILVSAISSYDADSLALARHLGQFARVLCSPNITLSINFLIMAAKLLQSIAPFADVEILEQHFKEKPEVSGTAKKIAESLALDPQKITSLRLGGIVGHHEVIFGFPYQTVRLTHDSIKREAFGTGVAFALDELSGHGKGFYTFDDLLMEKIKTQLLRT